MYQDQLSSAPHSQILIAQSPKSIGSAILLSLVLGPLGLLYATLSGGIIMSVVYILFIFITKNLVFVLLNMLCVIWACSSVIEYNIALYKKANVEFDKTDYKTAGIALLFLSSIIALFFFAFFISWQEDQSYIRGLNGFDVEKLYYQGAVIVNWFGPYGAILGYHFFYLGLGCSILLFPISTLSAGLQMLRLKNINPKLVVVLVFILLLVLPIVFASISKEPVPHIFEGLWAFKIVADLP